MVTAAVYGLIAMTALSIVVYGVTWLSFRLWCRPRRILSGQSPSDYDLQFEGVHFQSQGVALKGWFVPAVGPGGRAPAVILMHGWNHHAGRMLHLARAIHHEGYAVLLFDARGHGHSGSDGPSYVLKFAQDIMAAVDYLETRPEIDNGRIGVVGHSMGGSGAILAAAMDRRIGAVASSSSFSDPIDFTRDMLKKLHIPGWPFLPIMHTIFKRWIGMPTEAVSPRRRIGEIAAPVLLAHGARDDYIVPDNMEILHQNACPRTIQTLMLDDCKHSDMLADQFYFENVTRFLYQALKPERICCQPKTSQPLPEDSDLT